MRKVMALLVGRQGSVGFPNKNIFPLVGRPMMVYPLLAALNAKNIDEVYLSTDSPKMKEIARNYGAGVIDRPAELCTKEALGEDVFVHGYKYFRDVLKKDVELIVLLFCNAPTIVSETLDKGIEVLRKDPSIDSCATASVYNMWSPVRARKIGEDGLLQPFIPFEAYRNKNNISCDRDSMGDVYFADCSGYVVTPRCLEDLNYGMLPQRWMGKKIYPLKGWGGLDIDFEWQVPQAEYWLRVHGFSETATPYDGAIKVSPKSHVSSLYRTPPVPDTRHGKMRLDKNERTVGFDDRIFKEMLSVIDQETIVSYPEPGVLYKKLAKWLGCGEDEVIVTNGSDGAIKSVFEAFVEPGDQVVTLNPTYAMYDVYCDLYGAHKVPVDFRKGLALSIEELLGKIIDGVKLVAIANPNSPTGTVIKEEDLLLVIDKAHSKGALALIDEAYYGFYDKTAVRHAKERQNVIVTRTFSKTAGLAGLRIGCAIGSSAIIKALYNVKPMYETSAIALKLAEYIMDHDQIVGAYIRSVAEGKGFLVAGLKEMGIDTYESFANFVVARLPGSSDRVANALNGKGILIKGSYAHPSLQDTIRITVGPKRQMETFLAEFKRCLNEVRKDHDREDAGSKAVT